MSWWRNTWKEPWMEEVYLKIRNGNLAEVSSMNVFIIDTDSCVCLRLCIGQAMCY